MMYFLSLTYHQVGYSHECLQGAVEDYEGRVLSVAEELEATRSSYQGACEEIAHLKEQLLAMGVLQDQHHLLQQEVGVAQGVGGAKTGSGCVCTKLPLLIEILQLKKREEMLSQLQENEEDLKETWRGCLERAEEAESAQRVLEEEHRRVQGELEAQERHVEVMERRVAEERARREEEVDSLEEQLQQECTTREQEVAKCTQELKAQVCMIFGWVKGRLIKYSVVLCLDESF